MKAGDLVVLKSLRRKEIGRTGIILECFETECLVFWSGSDENDDCIATGTWLKALLEVVSESQ